MKRMQTKQYTIRNLSEQLDKALRRKAKETGKSLNEVVVDSLCRGTGLSDEPLLYHDLDHLIGTWQKDAKFEKALKFQDLDCSACCTT